MRKYKRIASIFVAATLTASLFAGCQKSPEKEIVSNKDMDNMIEQAQDTQSSTTEVAQVAKDYDTYQTDIKDDSLHVTVHADAQVDIPDTSQLSIFRVQQMQFDQAFLDQVRTTLFGEQTLYDGTCLSQLTKADYESEIQAGKDDIAEIQNNNLYSDDDKEVMIQERQSNIDECQAKYETAPEAINYTGSPSDNQIHSISELVSNNPSNEYYSWQSEFDGANASIFYGINDASNGSYQSLYLQNNENYGNLIRYRSSKLGYINVGSSVMSGGNYSDAVPEEYKFAMEEAHWVWPADEDMPIDKISEESGMAKENFIENTKDVTTISEADARQKAEDLLHSLGMHDFTYYSGGLVTEVTEYNKIEALRQSLGGAPYRTVYAFRYQRCIDGVFVNNDGGSKIVDEWQGDTYNKKLWSTEDVVVFVDDDGIVGFDYLVPLEVTDTVVEKSTLKNFDEVKDIFEQMAITMNAVNSEEASDGNVTIDIDSVKLRYTRISEKDSFDTGLLVPVWDFIGTKTDQYGYEVQNAVIMSINAIDGSVIDRSLGY